MGGFPWSNSLAVKQQLRPGIIAMESQVFKGYRYF